MDGSKLSFISPHPHKGEKKTETTWVLSKLQLRQLKVKNNNVTSPSPICPCCMSNEEKKKKNNLSNIVKRINCDFIYQLLKLKKKIWPQFCLKKEKLGWLKVNLMDFFLFFMNTIKLYWTFFKLKTIFVYNHHP